MVARIADLCTASVIMGGACTLYCRVRDRPSRYIVLQTLLIGCSGLALFVRDATVLVFRSRNPSHVYRASTLLLSACYGLASTCTFWMFAYKYWTASLSIAQSRKGKSQETETGPTLRSGIQRDSLESKESEEAAPDQPMLVDRDAEEEGEEAD